MIERVRTAEASRWCCRATCSPAGCSTARAVENMMERSIYDVLERELGVVINSGVARFRPVRANHAGRRPPRRPPQ